VNDVGVVVDKGDVNRVDGEPSDEVEFRARVAVDSGPLPTFLFILFLHVCILLRSE
jgi:hypothetical protein